MHPAMVSWAGAIAARMRCRVRRASVYAGARLFRRIKRAGSGAMTVTVRSATPGAAEAGRPDASAHWLAWCAARVRAISQAERPYLGALVVAYAYFLAPASTN